MSDADGDIGSTEALCDMRRYSFYRAGDALAFDSPHESHTLLACSRCGLIRTDPSRSDSELSLFYDGNYYTGPHRKFICSVEALVTMLGRNSARRILRDGCSRSQNVGEKKLRVLEPGCGRGRLLKALHRLGCDCTGLERPDFPVGHTDGSIRFAAGDVYHMPFPENSFDLVILWYVLEHLADPATALRESVRVLRTGGRLLIAVPNIKSWQSRIFKRNWTHMDVPRHTHHFSRESLFLLADKAGLKPVTCKGCDFEQSMFGFVQSGLNALFPVSRLNRLFCRIKTTHSLTEYMECCAWLLVAIPLLPFAFLEYVFSICSRRSALIRMVAEK